MPITLPPKRGLPERIKRHAALRDLARAQAADDGNTLSRAQANARAKELAQQPLPHTADFWQTVIKPRE